MSLLAKFNSVQCFLFVDTYIYVYIYIWLGTNISQVHFARNPGKYINIPKFKFISDYAHVWSYQSVNWQTLGRWVESDEDKKRESRTTFSRTVVGSRSVKHAASAFSLSTASPTLSISAAPVKVTGLLARWDGHANTWKTEQMARSSMSRLAVYANWPSSLCSAVSENNGTESLWHSASFTVG